MSSVGREFQDGELVPGTRYRVLSQIGAGGMGSVYVVEHVELGKRFVLKALLRDLARRKDLVARLRQEWRALARLNHPNIINVTDAGTSDSGVPFYVMEHVDGETLSQRLHAQRRMPLVEALAIGAGVLDGLAAAHEIGIVHRDIKPPNIFLVGRTGVKLLDFGIAKIAHSHAEVITARGVAIGTPRYMSPEQARGETVDGRADLYATGLILFEMVSGVGPFDDAKDANELLLAHLGREAARVSWAVPGVPAEVDAIISRLLAKQPTARPTSAAQVASTLRAIASRVVSVSSQAPTPARRPDAPIAAGTESSISAVPTNPMHAEREDKTFVPPGGFTQVAPTDPNPSPISELADVHSMRTVSDPIGSATTQFETPRVGTPGEAQLTPDRVSVGNAPASAAYDNTQHASPPPASLGDTLHSPSLSEQKPRSGAPSRFDRTLRIDELVPVPPDSGVATRTAIPVPEGGETPPPVESGDLAPPPVVHPRGIPAWIPLVATGVVITAVVSLGTWIFLGMRRAPSAELAAPAPPPVAEPAPVELKPPVEAPAAEPEPKAPPVASAEPTPPPKAPSPSPTPVAAPIARPRAAQPAPKPAEAAKPAAPAPEPTQPPLPKAAPAPTKPAPKLDMPGSGL